MKKLKRKTNNKRKKPVRKIRKHPGINQTTGRLKKGYRYNSAGRIVKAKSK